MPIYEPLAAGSLEAGRGSGLPGNTVTSHGPVTRLPQAGSDRRPGGLGTTSLQKLGTHMEPDDAKSIRVSFAEIARRCFTGVRERRRTCFISVRAERHLQGRGGRAIDCRLLTVWGGV